MIEKFCEWKTACGVGVKAQRKNRWALRQMAGRSLKELQECFSERIRKGQWSRKTAASYLRVLLAYEGFCRTFDHSSECGGHHIGILQKLLNDIVRGRSEGVPRCTLTRDQWRKLLVHLECLSDNSTLLTGPQRGTIYRLTAECGLRGSDLRRIMRRDFIRVANQPCLRVSAGKSRETVLPVLSGTYERVQHHFCGRPHIDLERIPLFDELPVVLSRMVRRDLERAEITLPPGRRFDFHALRDMTATHLHASGCPLPVIQRFLRHASLRTTIDYYIRHGHDGTCTDARRWVEKCFGDKSDGPPTETSNQLLRAARQAQEARPAVTASFGGLLRRTPAAP